MAGPHAAVLHATRLPKAHEHSHRDEFVVNAGDIFDFEFACHPSHEPMPDPSDVGMSMTRTAKHWHDWASDITPHGDYEPVVRRSLLVLKALTHEETGGIVAAPTTSLPEFLGGERNWDYRFCWLRDAALTLQVMMTHGYGNEALQWRDWLLRAIAGDHHQLQIMYGLDGKRELSERVLHHLPGYAGSVPVRIGNGAVSQYQGDVIGEVHGGPRGAAHPGRARGPFLLAAAKGADRLRAGQPVAQGPRPVGNARGPAATSRIRAS